MPWLNFSQVLLSPWLADTFDILRRAESVSSKGRLVVTTTTIPGLRGVVTVGSPNDVQNGEDYQKQPRSLTIVTKNQLLGALSGQQPDLVLWRGSAFRVTDVGPYPQFGEGFYQVECSSILSTDPDFPSLAQAEQLVFNQPAKSGYFTVIRHAS